LTDKDPNNVLYGPDGATVWEPRPLPKIVQDLMKPVPNPVPAEISILIQPLTLVVDAASSNSHNKIRSKVAIATLTTNADNSQMPVIITTDNDVVAEATSTTSNNKKQTPVNYEAKAVAEATSTTPVNYETETVSEVMSMKGNEVMAEAN
jgi:hypothetical protein